MTDTEAKDLTAVLCNLHDQIASLRGAIDALTARLPAAAPPPPPIPEQVPAPPAKQKVAPWPDRLRLWLDTPDAKLRFTNGTLTLTVIRNVLKDQTLNGNSIGRVLMGEGLVRVAATTGDYYIKDPMSGR